MALQTENYAISQKRLPSSGKHILAYQEAETLTVYQAYNSAIADYAIKHQHFGGSHFSYSRMSWIKPNFLWMMYRCGWASKENQERVLAITVFKNDFDTILGEAAFSTFNPSVYESSEIWKKEVAQKEVRLQWDPDHDPFGNKLERRAIQLGIRGEMLKKFGQTQINSIQDITDFVKQQKVHVDNNELEKLEIPVENIYKPLDRKLCEKIGLTE